MDVDRISEWARALVRRTDSHFEVNASLVCRKMLQWQRLHDSGIPEHKLLCGLKI